MVTIEGRMWPRLEMTENVTASSEISDEELKELRPCQGVPNRIRSVSGRDGRARRQGLRGDAAGRNDAKEYRERASLRRDPPA
jgi:hypothetical protein